MTIGDGFNLALGFVAGIVALSVALPAIGLVLGCLGVILIGIWRAIFR